VPERGWELGSTCPEPRSPVPLPLGAPPGAPIGARSPKKKQKKKKQKKKRRKEEGARSKKGAYCVRLRALFVPRPARSGLERKGLFSSFSAHYPIRCEGDCERECLLIECSGEQRQTTRVTRTRRCKGKEARSQGGRHTLYLP
jgi:hypothetical protein